MSDKETYQNVQANPNIKQALSVLGLRQGAAPEEIKATWRKKVRMYHSDTRREYAETRDLTDEEALKMYMKVNDAYYILTGRNEPQPEAARREEKKDESDFGDLVERIRRENIRNTAKAYLVDLLLVLNPRQRNDLTGPTEHKWEKNYETAYKKLTDLIEEYQQANPQSDSIKGRTLTHLRAVESALNSDQILPNIISKIIDAAGEISSIKNSEIEIEKSVIKDEDKRGEKSHLEERFSTYQAKYTQYYDRKPLIYNAHQILGLKQQVVLQDLSLDSKGLKYIENKIFELKSQVLGYNPQALLNIVQPLLGEINKNESINKSNIVSQLGTLVEYAQNQRNAVSIYTSLGTIIKLLGGFSRFSKQAVELEDFKRKIVQYPDYNPEKIQAEISSLQSRLNQDENKFAQAKLAQDILTGIYKNWMGTDSKELTGLDFAKVRELVYRSYYIAFRKLLNNNFDQREDPSLGDDVNFFDTLERAKPESLLADFSILMGIHPPEYSSLSVRYEEDGDAYNYIIKLKTKFEELEKDRIDKERVEAERILLREMQERQRERELKEIKDREYAKFAGVVNSFKNQLKEEKAKIIITSLISQNQKARRDINTELEKKLSKNERKELEFDKKRLEIVYDWILSSKVKEKISAQVIKAINELTPEQIEKAIDEKNIINLEQLLPDWKAKFTDVEVSNIALSILNNECPYKDTQYNKNTITKAISQKRHKRLEQKGFPGKTILFLENALSYVVPTNKYSAPLDWLEKLLGLDK